MVPTGPSAVGAQVPQVQSSDAASRLQAAFGELQRAIANARASAPDQRLKIREIAGLATVLQSRARLIPSAAATDYARSINHQAAVLAGIGELAAADRVTAIAEVADDLGVKSDLGPGSGAGSRNPGYVAVKVVTKRLGGEVKGYSVTLNPVRYRHRAPFYRLGPLTPSSGLVTPGRYEVAAWRNGAIAARDIYRIGLHAEDEFIVELAIP
jgi:hypothetical protein